MSEGFPRSKTKYDEIYHKTFERFLLELARNYAAEEERVHLEFYGQQLSPEIRWIELTGEYPKTGFVITTYHPMSDRERTSWYPIWGNREFFDENHKPKREVERIVGDTLMLARGG